MVQAVVFRIIKELQKHGNVSSYSLSKILNLSEQNVRYHLNELVVNDILNKKGSKYFLIRTTFNYKGCIVIHIPEEKGFIFENCEYFDECQSCTGKISDSCKKIDSLPSFIKKLIE